MAQFENLPSDEVAVSRFAAVARRLSQHCGAIFVQTYRRLLAADDCHLFLYQDGDCEASLGLRFVPATKRYKIIYCYCNEPDNEAAATATAAKLCEFMTVHDCGLYTGLTLANYDPQVAAWSERLEAELKRAGATVTINGNYYEVNPCPSQ